MIYNVTRSKALTDCLLVLGLQNIKGERKISQILNRCEPCIDYNITCTTETAQALTAQTL